jgi:hypothetical protein
LASVSYASYRSDQVREKLAGDPAGKVKAAAAQLDLEKVMASGVAPKVAFISPSAGLASALDEVEIQARSPTRAAGSARWSGASTA